MGVCGTRLCVCSAGTLRLFFRNVCGQIERYSCQPRWRPLTRGLRIESVTRGCRLRFLKTPTNLAIHAPRRTRSCRTGTGRLIPLQFHPHADSACPFSQRQEHQDEVVEQRVSALLNESASAKRPLSRLRSMGQSGHVGLPRAAPTMLATTVPAFQPPCPHVIRTHFAPQGWTGLCKPPCPRGHSSASFIPA
jgi:hypothetical protein